MKKTAIVTGGASGIGRAIVLHLAELDYDVAVMDRIPLEISRSQKGYDKIRSFECDVIDFGAAGETFARVEQAIGTPWLLVNNVGGTLPRPFLETGVADWRTMVDLNLMTALNMHHIVVPRMIASGGGRVVNISSDSARFGVPGVAVYAACKGAIIAFTKCIAKELADKNILVNAICPGTTETPALHDVLAKNADGEAWVQAIVDQIPLGRMAVPEDYPYMVALLADRGGDYITGQTFSINGGKSMV